MDFTLDETQREIVDLARDVLTRETEPYLAWRALSQAGLLTLATPERFGGAGLGVLETALVLTEVGRQAVQVPALETLALGALPIARAGTEEQRRTLLGAVAEGATLTAAITEPSAPLPATPRTTALPDPSGGWVVSGTLVGVRSAGSAHRILVPATLAGGARAPGSAPDGDPTGTGVLLVDPQTPGVTRTATRTSAGTAEFTVHLSDARVPSDALLGDDRSGVVLAGLHRSALVGACAVGDGLLSGALQLTADHLRKREQFGRPLATFQAVAQQVADAYLASRTLHLATLAACWELDSSSSDAGAESGDVEVAGYWLAERALPALHVCQHLHGGLGMDVSYPLHRHYAMTKDLTRFVGGVDRRLAGLAS
ncbi:acyl-CoA dehydrogenase family protein [Pseudonocardia eucalypti]|uniref:Acyl-CoA dehydrogenase family protein n=1 Tax=Pseudonocardia eucalypti TaxID=648755 RepID=A0ABP9PDY4_9PSEU|nr:alkylation response protein AidB-like acyl-CoA dehydrogenase [Pseudonocardia eucalypti]